METQKSQQNVFVSHSSKDKEFVRRLVADLQKQNLEVWFDEKDIIVGDSIPEKISLGLEATDFLIFVISKDSVKSGWVSAEWNSTLMSQFSSKYGKIIPVLIDDAEIPKLLSHIKYADFRSYDVGLSQLLRVFEQKTEAETKSKPETEIKPNVDQPIIKRKIGQEIVKYCNREFQEHQFNQQFKINKKTKSPYIYIVHGHNKEAHSSLVQRFLLKYIQSYANHKYGNYQGAVTFKKISDWAYIGKIEAREQKLLEELFKLWEENYEHNEKEYTPNNLKELINVRLEKIIVIQHDIPLSKFDSTANELLIRYINFWNKVLDKNDEPKLFLFFNIKYPAIPPANKLLANLVRSPFHNINKWRIQYSLQKAFPSQLPESQHKSSLLILKELSCVGHEDVEKWFEKHQIDDETVVNYRDYKIDLMFRKDGKLLKKRCMKEIEPYLRNIVKEFEQRQKDNEK